MFYKQLLKVERSHATAKLTSEWEGLGDVLGQRGVCVLLLAG